MTTESIEERLTRLETAVTRAADVTSIQNLIGKETYYYEATEHEKRFSLLATETPGVTVEIGGRGVFEGLESAHRTMVESEVSLERRHGEGMRMTFPDVEFEHDTAGMAQSQLVGTPVIEVAGDGETAQGMWIALMAVAKTYDRPEEPEAKWVWWKIAADFVKERGEWKIWHLLKNPLFATDYDASWVQQAIHTPPPTPAEMNSFHETDADRPFTKQYRSYRITLVPALVPPPPEPFDTFEQTEGYSY